MPGHVQKELPTGHNIAAAKGKKEEEIDAAADQVPNPWKIQTLAAGDITSTTKNSKPSAGHNLHLLLSSSTDA